MNDRVNTFFTAIRSGYFNGIIPNKKDLFIYPDIPEDVDSLVRNRFRLFKNVILFVALNYDYKTCSLGFVITDYGISINNRYVKCNVPWDEIECISNDNDSFLFVNRVGGTSSAMNCIIPKSLFEKNLSDVIDHRFFYDGLRRLSIRLGHNSSRLTAEETVEEDYDDVTDEYDDVEADEYDDGDYADEKANHVAVGYDGGNTNREDNDVNQYKDNDETSRRALLDQLKAKYGIRI